MLVVSKSRVVGALLLFFLVDPLTGARSADIPFRKGRLDASQERAGTTRPVIRTITRQEILHAIQNDLTRMGITGAGGLLPGDLEIQSSLPALKDDMGLQVKKIGFDPIRRATIFEMWTSHAPKYLPFEVTTRRNPESLGLTPHPKWNPGDADGETRSGNPATDQGLSRARSKLPILAKPGKQATLVMLGQNVRITTTVVPLQPGTKGQCILVRDLATARVMKAEVVDQGLLRTSF
jgi:hypothetical protein